MGTFRRVRCWVRPLVWAAMLVVPVALCGADKKDNAAGEKIDIFAGIAGGQLDVKLIPQDEKTSQLIVTNKTDRPLSVQLPAAVAGVPVLAQFNMPMNQQNQNQPQPIGGGPQGNMMNVGNNNLNLGQNMVNGPGMMWNIAPEKVGKFRLTTVCLDHDKAQPRPRIPYELKPIREVTDKPGVAEVCAMLARGMVSQRVAQLAAWHLNNGKTWEELAAKRERTPLANVPQYSKGELEAAKKLAEQAVKMAQGDKESSSSKS